MQMAREMVKQMGAALVSALALALAPVIASAPVSAVEANNQGANAGAATTAPPKRIVSINLCTDQLLVDLVPKDRIAGLSRLAADPVLSAVAGRIDGIRLLRGQAEEVLALRPDVVLTTSYSTPEVVALLRRLGVRVELIDMATDLDGIRQSIRKVAGIAGVKDRGEKIIDDFDRRIRLAAPRTPYRPTALAYQINSLTSGPGGLIDAALGAAGFRNVAANRPLGPAGRLPLETFISHPPDLVVLAHDPAIFRTVMADNLRHRAFRDLLNRRRHLHVPMPLWLCGTRELATAIEQLGRERAALLQASAGDRAGAGLAAPFGFPAPVGFNARPAPAPVRSGVPQ